MQNYSRIEKILHDIVLSNKFINKSLFEIEKIIFGKNLDFKNKTHLFITSLPRSGTTSLLNFIYETGNYGSLTYKNMPFILSPNLSKLFHINSIKKKERLHKDGINYDINSPEALDEIFFKNEYEFVKLELVNYINLILFSEKKYTYLSKNNLNYKRIDLIKSLFPNTKFLIPIREPLHQAYSLYKQHIHFSKLQKEDDFIRRYMNYLGHNEFALNHKPWNKPEFFLDLNHANYWLEQWYLFYKNIYNKYHNHSNCVFIVYEELINNNYLEKIIEKIDLKLNANSKFNFFKNSNVKKLDIEFNEGLLTKAKDIYKKYISLQLNN